MLVSNITETVRAGDYIGGGGRQTCREWGRRWGVNSGRGCGVDWGQRKGVIKRGNGLG